MDESQTARYLRQTIFAPIGTPGQQKLLASRVLIAGCGATGSFIANMLGRAGVGHIRIVDRDYLELNNLQRQVMYDETDLEAGLPKAVAAARHLREINSSISVEPVVADINAESVEELIEGVDLVLDGTDNFETRFLLNEACIKLDRPWIYCGAVASYGATMTIVPRKTACLRCVFKNVPSPGALATCDTAGVIAPIVGLIASIACSEALKVLIGAETRGRGIVHIDLWENTFDTVQVERDENCPACVRHEFEFLESVSAGSLVSRLCGRNAVQVRARRANSLDLPQLADRLSRVGSATLNEYLVQFVTGSFQMTIFSDGRAIVKGTEDEAVARGLYSKYIGN